MLIFICISHLCITHPTQWNHRLTSIIYSFLFLLLFQLSERRPLKTQQIPMPLFRSPSARLVQHDQLDDYRGSDGSIMGSLGGINKEVHHYTFQPSKQIVSTVFFYHFTNHNQIAKKRRKFLDTKSQISKINFTNFQNRHTVQL